MRVKAEAVHQVTDELVEATRRLLPQLSTSAAPLTADNLTEIASHQATTLFIARSEGVIVGMLTLVTFPLPSGLRARIEDGVVDQKARGHGVGTALTMAALDRAQQQGARSSDLTSRASRWRPTSCTSSSASGSATPTPTDISPSRQRPSAASTTVSCHGPGPC